LVKLVILYQEYDHPIALCLEVYGLSIMNRINMFRGEYFTKKNQLYSMIKVIMKKAISISYFELVYLKEKSVNLAHMFF